MTKEIEVIVKQLNSAKKVLEVRMGGIVCETDKFRVESAARMVFEAYQRLTLLEIPER